MVQLSHPYMTTWKAISLTKWTFVGKVMRLHFNTFSFVTTFLPRSKHLSISWLQLPFLVILEPKKIKSVIVSIVSLSICCEVMGPDATWNSGWMNHKLESRFLGEISVTSDMQITPPLWQKKRRTKEPLDKTERGEWKSLLKTQHSEN